MALHNYSKLSFSRRLQISCIIQGVITKDRGPKIPHLILHGCEKIRKYKIRREDRARSWISDLGPDLELLTTVYPIDIDGTMKVQNEVSDQRFEVPKQGSYTTAELLARYPML